VPNVEWLGTSLLVILFGLGELLDQQVPLVPVGVGLGAYLLVYLPEAFD